MLLMKQTARIISTYAADVSGVCSALYELGGMTVMHDASGCNSTYNTHDEPRWYDMDSMVYISALSEMEAVMGDDRKLVDDIVSVAKELHPGFIAVAGTPIPMVIGTDFEAVAAMIEKESGIPTMGFPTNGMHSYLSGASMAFAGLARRFCLGETEKTGSLSANILGLTPLDFSVNGSAQDIKALLEQNGIEVVSSWAMGSSLEELQRAGAAHVNLVVSHAGLETAKLLKERFGTPYVAGVPVGREFSSLVVQTLRSAAKTGENAVAYPKKARGHLTASSSGRASWRTRWRRPPRWSGPKTCVFSAHWRRKRSCLAPTACTFTTRPTSPNAWPASASLWPTRFTNPFVPKTRYLYRLHMRPFPAVFSGATFQT